MIYYIDQIISTLKTGNVPVGYYLIGEPENIPKEVAEMEFIILNPTTETIEMADTQRDGNTGEITLTVGVQVREDYNKEDYTQYHLYRCMEIMEGRTATGTLNSNTVLYNLRQALTDIGLFQESLVINYEDQRDENYIYAISATLRFYDQRNR